MIQYRMHEINFNVNYQRLHLLFDQIVYRAPSLAKTEFERKILARPLMKIGLLGRIWILLPNLEKDYLNSIRYPQSTFYERNVKLAFLNFFFCLFDVKAWSVLYS